MGYVRYVLHHGCLLLLSLASGYSLDFTEFHNNSSNIQANGARSPRFLGWQYWRADEDNLVVGLGSGTIHITGLVKHSFVRLAWLVSHI